MRKEMKRFINLFSFRFECIWPRAIVLYSAHCPSFSQMADAQNNNPQEIAHDRRNDKTFNVPKKKNRKRYRTVILCAVGMRYRVRRYKWFGGKAERNGHFGKAASSLVVSTTALSLVARSGMNNSLVDLPLRAGLVARFGLGVKIKS